MRRVCALRPRFVCVLQRHKPYDFKRYLAWNIGIVAVTVTVGILAPGIDVVLGLVGSTCSPLMM